MKSWYLWEITDINKCASELYQCSVWFSLNALNFTKAARAGPDQNVWQWKVYPSYIFFFVKKCVKEIVEKGALCSMLWSVSEEHVCALPRPLSPAASAKWIKKASSWLCIRTLASYQEDEKCFIETTYASSHADLHTHATHPHAYSSQIHEICSWGVSDRGEYNDRY